MKVPSLITSHQFEKGGFSFTTVTWRDETFSIYCNGRCMHEVSSKSESNMSEHISESEIDEIANVAGLASPILPRLIDKMSRVSWPEPLALVSIEILRADIS